MPLSVGSRLGSYEIVAPLGAGGMGEVYRARDTKLHREVAIKVLPADVAADPERMARLDREAKTLASLNHSHIAQIYGVEDTPTEGGAFRRALVMEFVEGEDLASRIARGPLPMDEALHIARQIANALDAAHMAGIVHRDLKPANIRVRPDGAVKVLDFGLAKAIDAGVGGARQAAPVQGLPTITSPAVTHAGIILGTAAYMSPEQARGKFVDKRTDVWAFGCVVYEMLTGRPAFDGETVTDVLGSIVKSEPDWSRLPTDTPARLRHLLRHCLQKDATTRLRDIGDALVALEGSAVEAPAVATLVASRRRTTTAIVWGAGVLVAIVAAAIAGYSSRPMPEVRVEKFNVAIQRDGGVTRIPVISPDGRRVAYVGSARIWVQSLDEWAPRELAGTEGAGRLFWSPDSQWIAYFRSEALLKVPAAGGPVVRVATLPAVQAPLAASSGAWGDDGTIIVSLATGPLLRVASGGGTPAPLVDGADNATAVRDIELMPNGMLVAVVSRRDPTRSDGIGIVDNGVLRTVLDINRVRHPSFAPSGHLVFERLTTPPGIWAVPFSLARGQVTGEPFLIDQGVEPSVARDGTLAFATEGDAMPRQLAWFDFDGKVGARISDARDWLEGVSLSRDGRRLLASAADGVWVYDVETGARSRVTTGPADITPQWVDDRTIVFVRTDGESRADRNAGAANPVGPTLMLKGLAPGAEERTIGVGRFPRVTADGHRIVFNGRNSQLGLWEVAWVERDRPTEIHRLGAEHVGARFPSVSPDGTLVAYVSGEVGRDEVFLTRMPSGEGKWQISPNGGGWTLFSPRGDAVLYRAPDGALMSVSIGNSKDLRISPPQKLFDWGAAWAPFYELAADGRRGITAVPVGSVTQVRSVSIIKNWHRQFTPR